MLHMQSPLNQVYSEEGFAIYIGSAANAANTKALNDAGIKYILNVSDRVRFKRMDGPPIIMYQVPLSDFGDTPLTSVLEECFSIINEAKDLKGNVLVHCQGGVNRSPTVVVAYLMYTLKWNLKRAWEHVKERRSAASPHEKYMQQLVEIEKELFNGASTLDYDEYSATSVQATLRQIRKQQIQSTQLPFQDRQAFCPENGTGDISVACTSPSSSIHSTTTSSSHVISNSNNVNNASEITATLTATTEISNNDNNDKSNNYNHFPHHLPQLNLECIS